MAEPSPLLWRFRPVDAPYTGEICPRPPRRQAWRRRFPGIAVGWGKDDPHTDPGSGRARRRVESFVRTRSEEKRGDRDAFLGGVEHRRDRGGAKIFSRHCAPGLESRAGLATT